MFNYLKDVSSLSLILLLSTYFITCLKTLSLKVFQKSGVFALTSSYTYFRQPLQRNTI